MVHGFFGVATADEFTNHIDVFMDYGFFGVAAADVSVVSGLTIWKVIKYSG